MSDNYGQRPIGFKNGLAVFVSETALAQVGERRIREELGMARRFPVKTDLSGNIVMVEADSHEEAVERYLAAKHKTASTAGGGVR